MFDLWFLIFLQIINVISIILIFYFMVFLFFVLNKSIIWNIWVIIDLIYQIREIYWIIRIVSIKLGFFKMLLLVSFIVMKIVLINIVDLILIQNIIILEILWNLIFRLGISKNFILLINHMKLSCFSCNSQFLWKRNIKVQCLILILHSGNPAIQRLSS